MVQPRPAPYPELPGFGVWSSVMTPERYQPVIGTPEPTPARRTCAGASSGSVPADTILLTRRDRGAALRGTSQRAVRAAAPPTAPPTRHAFRSAPRRPRPP